MDFFPLLQEKNTGFIPLWVATHNGINPVFFSCNRGKKSIALDLKSQEGKEILFKLAEDADVFMQNFRPGAIDQMGFGEKVIREINKDIIYLSISGHL